MVELEKDFSKEIQRTANDVDNVIKLQNMIGKYDCTTVREFKTYIDEQKSMEEDELDDAEEMLQFADSYGLVDDPIEDFIGNAIEVKYTRELGSDSIADITIVLGIGGPHIELSLSEQAVEGWWGNTHIIYHISSNTARALWDYVETLIL